MPKATLPAVQNRDSKYARLADGLRRQIESGLLKPGDQLPSYAQMLAQHGVGQNTAEKMFALLEQDGLIIREPNRGIFVAVAKRRGSTGTIGLFADSAGAEPHPYHSRMLAGIQDAAHKRHFEVLLLHGNSLIDLEKIDGLLVNHRRGDRVLKRLPAGLPAISLIYKSTLATSVTADDYCGIQSAVAHLLAQNHRRIAYFSGGIQEWTDAPSRQRLKAYRETLQTAGITPDPRWVRPVFEHLDVFPASFDHVGHLRMSKWLGEDWKELGCTALLTQNDDVAMGAIDALREAGIRVPDELSLIGFDDTEIARAIRPRLTSVAVPLYEIGARGVELLLEQIETGVPQLNSVVLPTALQVRESTSSR